MDAVELTPEMLKQVKGLVVDKLKELNCYLDDDLPEYIMVLVSNKRNQHHIENDLQLFLNDDSASFTKWLSETVIGFAKGGKEMSEDEDPDGSPPQEQRRLLSSVVVPQRTEADEPRRESRDTDRRERRTSGGARAPTRLLSRAMTESAADDTRSRKREEADRTNSRSKARRTLHSDEDASRNSRRSSHDAREDINRRRSEEPKNVSRRGSILDRLGGNGRQSSRRRVVVTRRTTPELPADDDDMEEDESDIQQEEEPEAAQPVEQKTAVREKVPRKPMSERLGKKIPAETSESSTAAACSFWPNCTKGAACPYTHPAVAASAATIQIIASAPFGTTSCTKFPKCPFGNKCRFQHPKIKCKFGSKCTNAKCNYIHPVVKLVEEICRYHPSCTNPKCHFQHPKVCRYAGECKRTDCVFVHPKPRGTSKTQVMCRFGKECKREGCTFAHPTANASENHISERAFTEDTTAQATSTTLSATKEEQVAKTPVATSAEAE